MYQHLPLQPVQASLVGVACGFSRPALLITDYRLLLEPERLGVRHIFAELTE